MVGADRLNAPGIQFIAAASGFVKRISGSVFRTVRRQGIKEPGRKRPLIPVSQLCDGFLYLHQGHGQTLGRRETERKRAKRTSGLHRSTVLIVRTDPLCHLLVVSEHMEFIRHKKSDTLLMTCGLQCLKLRTIHCWQKMVRMVTDNASPRQATQPCLEFLRLKLLEYNRQSVFRIAKNVNCRWVCAPTHHLGLIQVIMIG